MSATELSATILHLSDLHLGANASDIGSSGKGTPKSVWKTRCLVMQTHDQYILSTLATEIKTAARVVGAPGDCFDFHCVTGDISTCATTIERFTFARDFLTATVPLDAASPIGLRLDRQTLFCVPGNHDKLWEITSDRYLSAFQDLPKRPPYNIIREARNGRLFAFIGIDSNLYEEGNMALGEISATTLGWLDRELSTCPPDSVRILLLHHHPADLNRFRRRGPVDLFKDRFTVLTEGKRLLACCKDRVDVIMHGHEHFPVAFKDEDSGSVVVSAGSAAQWQRDESIKNSFHILVFGQTTLRVVQFNWKGARFVKDERNDQTFTLHARMVETP